MIWALGWKGWVELRRARSAPKAECSEVKHVLDPAALPPYSRRKFIMLRQFCYRGGTFLASLPRRRFASLTKLSCPPGAVIPIPPAVALKLKGLYEHAPDQTASQT